MLSTISSLVSTPAKIYSSYKLTDAIREIKREVNQVYADIASAHFSSALQAFSAAQTSRNAEIEVRSGIAHLRDAYNVYEFLLRKKKQLKSWFGLGSVVAEVNVIAGKERAKIYLGNSEIATLVALNYNELGELTNARNWKSRAISDCISYSTIISDKSGSELYEINREYAEEVYHAGQVSYSVYGMDKSPYYEYKITSKGHNYLNSLRTRDVDKLKEIFLTKNI